MANFLFFLRSSIGDLWLARSLLVSRWDLRSEVCWLWLDLSILLTLLKIWTWRTYVNFNSILRILQNILELNTSRIILLLINLGSIRLLDPIFALGFMSCHG